MLCIRSCFRSKYYLQIYNATFEEDIDPITTYRVTITAIFRNERLLTITRNITTREY